MTAPEAPIDPDSIDLGDFEFWSQPTEVREATFRALRRHRPISFHTEPAFDEMPEGPGYWSVVRYADVMHVSRSPQLFSSAKGTNVPDLPEALNELFGSMINMDSPRHTRLRLLVNRGFTPRMVNRLEQGVADRARAIVDAVAPLGTCDFVTDVAGPLPLQIICDMMGIGPSDHQWVVDQSNKILGAGDPEYGEGIQTAFQAGWELYEYAQALGQARLETPADDITSALMHAEVDGERLSAGEFGSFFILLVVAGNETTRNAISHGLLALTRHPDQRAIWMAEPDVVTPLAVEEIVRWASPVIHFRRTATADTEIAGQPIAQGDKVVVWYNSANRDEDAFPNPYRFDVRRTPNEHVGFGAGGPHFCLGAHLARREITVLFTELLRRLPDIEVTGEPAMLLSPFIHGIKHLPVSFSALDG
ncbi:MAG: cytochrome P450 [Acidimicrobiales bacterium]